MNHLCIPFHKDDNDREFSNPDFPKEEKCDPILQIVMKKNGEKCSCGYHRYDYYDRDNPTMTRKMDVSDNNSEKSHHFGSDSLYRRSTTDVGLCA